MSSDVVAVEARGLGKRYVIPHRPRASTLVERLGQLLRAPFGGGSDEELWALRGVDFVIPAGSAVGIIGRNGAGKSTLLKILSRITSPTTGELRLRGRVGSLLEVGTGFHPELTGRENIFLNGAILGMRRREIAARFDAIVDFAEIERFLDTPVKRYSSGMYVRLAFAVAAHLEPEILVVDEVLAVGDAEFQRKCLGKMGEVSGQGRTVIFVSHSMQAVSTLTQRVLLLERGECLFDGATAEGIARYRALQGGGVAQPAQYVASASQPPRGGNHVRAARVVTSDPGGVHRCGEPLRLEFDLEVTTPASTLCFSCKLVDAEDRNIAHLWCFDREARFRRESGRYTLRFEVPRARLFQGAYSVRAFLSDRRTNTMYDELHGICPFDVTMDGVARDDYPWTAGDCTYLETAEWVLAREGGSGEQRGPVAP
jgi:lipopolysaccharide transport system ATP-binding protein